MSTMKRPDERVIVTEKGEKTQVKNTENIFNKTIRKSHNKMFLT